MITLEELDRMKAVDIRTIDKADLVDIRDVRINTGRPISERIEDYIRQVKNPYCFKVGDVAVKVSFSENGGSFEDRFEQMLTAMG